MGVHVDDLSKAIFYFEQEKMRKYGSFDEGRAKGIIIGHEAFSKVLYDPESHRYVQDHKFRFMFRGVPMYRSGDIDLDKYEIF